MKPILLLPGMGADHRLHGRLRTKAFHRTLDWPASKPHWSLEDYATSIIAAEDIEPGDTIGGTSMGGMVALEIAKQVRVRRVLLMASATSWGHVSPYMRRFARLSPIAPFDLLPLTPSLPGFGTDSRLLIAMARTIRPGFMRWACRALATWEGYDGDLSLIRRIHGSHDRIVPSWGKPDVTVNGGGHLIALTHAVLVADFIDRSA